MARMCSTRITCRLPVKVTNTSPTRAASAIGTTRYPSIWASSALSGSISVTSTFAPAPRARSAQPRPARAAAAPGRAPSGRPPPAPAQRPPLRPGQALDPLAHRRREIVQPVQRDHVERAHQVGAVVHGDIRPMRQGGPDVLVIGGVIFAL